MMPRGPGKSRREPKWNKVVPHPDVDIEFQLPKPVGPTLSPPCHGPQQRAIQTAEGFTPRMDMRRLEGPASLVSLGTGP